MVATIGVASSGAEVTLVASSTPGLQSSEFSVMGVYNFPSVGVLSSEAHVTTVNKTTNSVQSSGAMVSMVVRGRIDNRKTRAFTFTLDGHDFYVLRLGAVSTLVYDLTTEQWFEWQSPDLNFWRPVQGLNWQGLGTPTFSRGFNNNVVLGDDVFGLLWSVDPTQGYDESPRPDFDIQAFTRKVVGGVPMRLRETQPVGAVYLTCDVGSPEISGASITLRTSDDYGKTWTSHGTITASTDTGQEFVWRSLGLIKAPGRIFELTDDGATARIDGLDMR